MGPFSGRSWGGPLYEALESRKATFWRLRLIAIQDRAPAPAPAPAPGTGTATRHPPPATRPPPGFLYSRIVHPYHTLVASTSESTTPITFWLLLLENRTPLSQFGFAKKDLILGSPNHENQIWDRGFFLSNSNYKTLRMGPFSGRSWGGPLYEALESRKARFWRFGCLPFRIVHLCHNLGGSTC